MHCLFSSDININCENLLRTLQYLQDKHAPLKGLTKKMNLPLKNYHQ